MTSTPKKLRPITGVITHAIQETKDTWTLLIHVSDQDREYVAGQFISIDAHQFPELADLIKYFEFEKGKTEPIRAYSLSSAPHEKHIAITIKPEAYHPHQGAFPPLLSPMLASNCFVGRNINFEGYTGAFITPRDLASSSTNAIYLAAGSGIAPIFSIIKNELHTKNYPNLKHKLLLVNKTIEDIIFHEELNKLAKKYSDNFQINYFLTQEDKNLKLPTNYYFGRPNITHVQDLIININTTLIFACGPALTKWQKKQAEQNNQTPSPRFMEWVQEVVTELGLDKKRYKREVYG